MDEDVKTRMQEIGPRLTLKLRWLKRGTLADGRRKAGGGVTGEQLRKVDKVDDEEVDDELASDGEGEAQIDQQVLDDDARDREAAIEGAEPVEGAEAAEEGTAEAMEGKKDERAPRRKTTFSRKTGALMIPRLKPTPADQMPVGNLAKGRRKPKKGASILDSINLQGGMLDSRKEWNWDVRARVCSPSCSLTSLTASHVRLEEEAFHVDLAHCASSACLCRARRMPIWQGSWLIAFSAEVGRRSTTDKVRKASPSQTHCMS